MLRIVDEDLDEVIIRYNPDQPRDDHGRFGEGDGGGGASANAPSGPGAGVADRLDRLHDDEDTIRATFEYHDSATGLRTEIDEIERSGPTTSVRMSIVDPDGRVVGQIDRTIRPTEDRTVVADRMTLDPEIQGQGFATRYNDNVEAALRDAGIERVEVEANIDVGGYSNARMGYDFANESSRADIAMRAQDMASRVPESAQIEFERLAADPRATPIEFAMVGYEPGATMWPGKELMLGSSWTGIKNLSEPSQGRLF